jgi:hypothetical protein
MAARASIRLCPLIAALLLAIIAGRASGATDVRADYLRAHGAAPADYVISRFADHRVVILGENHWLRHDVALVRSIVPKLGGARVGALAVEMFRAADQALIDSVTTAAGWSAADAMPVLRNAQWPYRDYLELIHAVWSVNHARAAGAPPLRLLALGAPDNWRETLLPLGKTYDGFMTGIVSGYLSAPDTRVLIYCGAHHAFTRYHQPELPRELKVDRFVDRMGNMLWREFGEDVFLVTLHRPWQRRVGARWGRDLPVEGAIDCAAAALGKPVAFDAAGSPFADLAITHEYWYGLGYPALRLEDITDGYVWDRPIERYQGAEVIPLAEFAPDAASFAQVSANNPLSDDKGLDRVALEALWKKEVERMADFVKASGWTPILGWSARCGSTSAR